MMVSISGERGVGKTLYLAERVYNKQQQGYFVITNFSHSHSNLDCSGLSPEEFLSVILNVIDFKDAGYEMFNLHPSFRHTGVYVGMDEATIYFSPEMQSRLSKSDPAKYLRLLNLLAQARKYDVEIDYVVQDPAKVGKDFRRYTETFIYLRWILKLKRLANVPHPLLPIFRREHRHLIDVIWEEVHDLDVENPVRNYRTVRDENGIAQWTEATTLLERHLRFTGMFKRHILRMYNSYQPVGVKQDEYRKEFSPLRGFKVIPGTFKKDKIPTFKKLFGIKPRDAELPPKVGFEDIILPPPDPRNKVISEVQSQKVITLSVKELQEAIARAYSKPLLRKKTPANLDTAKGMEETSSAVVHAEQPSSGEVRPFGIKKYIKKNDPKILLREKMSAAPLPPPPDDSYKPRRRRKVEQPDKVSDTPESQEVVPPVRRRRRMSIPGNVDSLRMHGPAL